MTTQDISGGPIALPIDDLLDQPAETIDVSTEPRLESEPEIISEPEQVEEPKKPAKPKDDPVARLKAEVEAARQRETQLLSERDHAAKVAAQKSREAQQATQRAQLSDYDLIANALSSATDKMAALEQQYASAFAEGDGAKAASIQRQMAVLGARVTQLEDGKARMEQMAEQQRRQVEQRRQQPQQQQQPRQQGDPFEASIAHFSEASKQWIRAHKDVVTQPGKWNEVIRAHHVAEDNGLDADTAEYFAFIEKKLKLRDDGDDEVQVVTQKPRRAIPAAPVSRDGVIGGISNRKVTLTPAEIQTASDLGMSKEDYARFKVKALQDGKYDHQQRV